MTQQSALPRSRLGRFSKLGALATSVAGNMLYHGGKSLLSGTKPELSQLLLHPANARRISDKLSDMRGAAMKVGQLLSMDMGLLLPREVSEIFTRLRNDAHQLPMMQVAHILQNNFGDDWQTRFSQFTFKPIASASIGQVHVAHLADGQKVAVKLQYPGVRDSIDSDISNIKMLLNLFKLIPDNLDIDPLIEDARQQLHAEADYLSEANFLREFDRLIGHDERFEVAEIFGQVSSQNILTTRFLDGIEVDQLNQHSDALRQDVSHALLELALKEVFVFGLVQTDSNFANYLYSENSKKIQLLDFGATRRYSTQAREHFASLLHACIAEDHNAILQAAIDIGYTHADDNSAYQTAIVDLLLTVTTPLRTQGIFDFKHSDLNQIMMDKLVTLRMQQRYTRLPPTNILFLHRKLGGLYLLLSHLGAKIDVAKLLRQSVLE